MKTDRRRKREKKRGDYNGENRNGGIENEQDMNLYKVEFRNKTLNARRMLHVKSSCFICIKPDKGVKIHLLSSNGCRCMSFLKETVLDRLMMAIAKRIRRSGGTPTAALCHIHNR